MSGIPAFSIGVPNQVPVFSRAPTPHTHYLLRDGVCVYMSIGSVRLEYR